MKRIISIIILTFLMLSNTACSYSNAMVMANKVDFKKEFDGYTGVFKLYDISNNSYISYNEGLFSKQDAPDSTFKVLLSLL